MSSNAKSRSNLDARIYERIMKRVGKRVRNLDVQVSHTTVRLLGECSTAYSKKLVQQAASALIEDESLQNEITVTVPRAQAVR